MRKIKEFLRLTHHGGLSDRQVALVLDIKGGRHDCSWIFRWRAWAVQRSEGRDLFVIAPLARTRSERLRRWRLAAGFVTQTVWNRSNRCAGARGGARVGRPKWARAVNIL
jgi:hypothetical protein